MSDTRGNGMYLDRSLMDPPSVTGIVTVWTRTMVIVSLLVSRVATTTPSCYLSKLLLIKSRLYSVCSHHM